MKKYLLLSFFLLITALSFAQGNYQDVVYLKNGSVIRGNIIEQVPNKSIKIETADKSVWVYQMDEIEKITKEQVKRSSISYYSYDDFGLEPGNKVIAEIGYLLKAGRYGMDRVKLNFIGGYQLNPYFSLGLGTGLRYYTDAEAALIPVFADFRTTFMNNKISPYLSMDLGYSFDATNDFEGVGFLLSPTFGVSIKGSNKSALTIGLGYEMQRMEFYSSYNYSIKSSENSGAISINVGISF
jgi:hypothetical protein